MPMLEPPLVLIAPLFVIALLAPVASIPLVLLDVVLMLPVDVKVRESPPFSSGTIGPWVVVLAVLIVVSAAYPNCGIEITTAHMTTDLTA